ncbi:MarR family winged helix-turn-helix transcriptional regulator [Sunxiuqinia sp. sy24]|uniref:MarR family winged helix-turn-helix transcriptional regulator n=1 Tax=Sunxiuqinia sp. sy24 TaxID=3461495 RepID=UPI0040459125
MKNKYALFKQLIDLFEEYEQEEEHLDLLGFSRWMIGRLEEEPEKNQKVVSKKKIPQDGVSSSFLLELNEKARFLEIISRMARYHEFYTRKALKDLIINTRLEFLFLQSIDQMEKAKKTDLINTYHLEYTTGMDTIRRLKNNGLLDEMQDESDKRAKLLLLTEKGKSVLSQSIKRIKDENTLFFAAISENKWKKVLPVLEEIDMFHDEVYQNHGDKPFAEISNLMDSLKHYRK